jgi:hypothetical protein
MSGYLWRWRTLRHGVICSCTKSNRAPDLRQISPSGKSIPIIGNRVKPSNQKYSAGQIRQIRSISDAVSCPPEGRIAIVMTRWARDAMDATIQRRMGLLRTVKSCGSGAAYAGEKSAGAIPPATVTTSSLHREEHEVSRNTIAQGMSACSPLTCMLVCRHSCALWHMRPRVQRAPGIPCALSLQERDNEISKLGRKTRRENAASHSVVIARLDRATSIPEAAVIEPMSRGVVVPRLSRGMTTVVDYRRRRAPRGLPHASATIH